MAARLFLSIFILALTPTSWALQLQSEVPTKIKKETSTETTLQPGENFELLPGETALALPQNGLPLMILSPSTDKTTVQITSADLKSFVDSSLAQMVNQQTNEILSALRKAETAMSQRNYAQATAILNPLRQKYPLIASILFMSASVEYLLKNRSTSIEYLQKGLALDPNDSAATKLLAELQGGKK